MARREIVTTVCDWCLMIDQEIEYEAVETISVSFGRDAKRWLDLCSEHGETARLLRAAARSRGHADGLTQLNLRRAAHAS